MLNPANGHFGMISSIGVMVDLVNVTAMIFGNETKILDNNIQTTYTFGEIIITRLQIIQATVGVLLMTAFFVFLKLSKFGLKTRALSNDAALFEVLGFNIALTRILVFALSDVFLAASSCLAAYDIGMDTHVGMPVLINAMVAMIIGGVGRFGACIAGGLLLGVLQSLVVYQFSANWTLLQRYCKRRVKGVFLYLEIQKSRYMGRVILLLI
jgi:branched-chain amino acid transport system permease protein